MIGILSIKIWVFWGFGGLPPRAHPSGTQWGADLATAYPGPCSTGSIIIVPDEIKWKQWRQSGLGRRPLRLDRDFKFKIFNNLINQQALTEKNLCFMHSGPRALCARPWLSMWTFSHHYALKVCASHMGNL